jgi:aryl-alcohol dehydrogenase-like predicted oxidoreductase
MMYSEPRMLGTSDLLVSAIGVGCNNFGRPGTASQSQEGTTAVLDEAVELGVTLLDTADIYGGTPRQSETLMGVALGRNRDRVVLATKFGHDAVDLEIADGAAKGSRAYIREAVEGSLRRLRTDHIDLYQMHSPDPATPIEQTIAALDELVTEGKILHFGHTQFSSEQVVEADAAARRLGGRSFISAQNQYNLLERGVESDVLPAVLELGLGFLPFFPLQNGLLTGKFSRTDHPADTRIMRQRPHIAENAPWDVLERYQAFCETHSVTMLEATISWLLAQPALTSVIAGVTRPQQLAQNVAASRAWRPSEDEVAEISEIFA